MATQVLFASPKAPSLTPTQALSPEESLDVVEIFINAAIACICHTRDLLPWDSDCFQTRYIDDLHSDFWKKGTDKYSAFCDTEPTNPSNKSQEFRILKRGEDKRADAVLDLIETAVFSAVGGGFLDALKFFITQGGTDCDPKDVLESYILNFHYDDEVGDDRSVRSISFNSSPAFTTDNTIKSFKKAIKRLLVSLQGLPRMPRRRSIGVAMLYNKQCPTAYRTPGFLTEDVPNAPSKQSGWQKLLLQESGDIGKFEVGLYKIIVGASNVRPSVELPVSSQMRGLRVSKQLQSLQKSSSQQRSGIASTLDDPGSQNPHNTAVTLVLGSDSCTPPRSGLVSPRPSPKKGSQRSGPPKIQVMSSHGRKRNVLPEKIAEILVQASAVETHREGEHIFVLEDLQQNALVRLDTSLGASMRCECYDPSNEGVLLHCRLCGTSQHIECYGWNDVPSIRLPDEHFCYSCLLLPREAELNTQMPTLVYKRLALAYIQQKNPANADDLINAMHLNKMQADDNEIFNTIIDELQKERYLTRRGLVITATMDKESSTLALRDYINPLAKISHHFSAIKDRETAEHRMDAIAAAVEEYTQGRAYLPSEPNVNYDFLLVNDAFENSTQRWGFYPDLVAPESRKRKAATPSVGETPPTQRMRHSVEVDQTPPLYQLHSSRRNQTPPPYRNMARKASCHEGTSPLDATPPPPTSSVRRMASRCYELVRVDRSSPSTVFDVNELFAEAVHVATSEVQWEHFGSGEGRR